MFFALLTASIFSIFVGRRFYFKSGSKLSAILLTDSLFVIVFQIVSFIVYFLPLIFPDFFFEYALRLGEVEHLLEVNLVIFIVIHLIGLILCTLWISRLSPRELGSKTYLGIVLTLAILAIVLVIHHFFSFIATEKAIDTASNRANAALEHANQERARIEQEFRN